MNSLSSTPSHSSSSLPCRATLGNHALLSQTTCLTSIPPACLTAVTMCNHKPDIEIHSSRIPLPHGCELVALQNQPSIQPSQSAYLCQQLLKPCPRSWTTATQTDQTWPRDIVFFVLLTTRYCGVISTQLLPAACQCQTCSNRCRWAPNSNGAHLDVVRGGPHPGRSHPCLPASALPHSCLAQLGRLACLPGSLCALHHAAPAPVCPDCLQPTQPLIHHLCTDKKSKYPGSNGLSKWMFCSDLSCADAPPLLQAWMRPQDALLFGERRHARLLPATVTGELGPQI